MEFTQTMFEYEFDGVTPQKCLTLKAMTAEELYKTVIDTIDELWSFSYGSQFREKPLNKLMIYLGELFRRNLLAIPMCDISQVLSEFGMSLTLDSIYALAHAKSLSTIKTYCHEQLVIIRFVKATSTKLLKGPLLSKQINDLMDELLDKNGNKPSQFKDFLTPDHYRMIRMGCDVSEWSVDEQEVLLACLKKM
jgi:hypothetical protein